MMQQLYEFVWPLTVWYKSKMNSYDSDSMMKITIWIHMISDSKMKNVKRIDMISESMMQTQYMFNYVLKTC